MRNGMVPNTLNTIRNPATAVTLVVLGMITAR